MVTPIVCKSPNFCNFTDFSLGCIEVISCNVSSFLAIFMKLHTVTKKTLSEQIIMTILHFWVKFVGFEQKYCQLSKQSDLYRNSSNGFIKHSLKIWVWSDHFSRFQRYWKFKIQGNKCAWRKPFWRSIQKLHWKILKPCWRKVRKL